MPKNIFKDLIGAEGDAELLRLVRGELEGLSHYTLWLQGDMGAGKTSFVRHYLYTLGLPEATPVVSPTYTIMNEYRIEDSWYAHLDLYRADARFSLDELGVHDIRPFKGIFVEWPEQGGELERLPPTHILSIVPSGEDRRSYSFAKI